MTETHGFDPAQSERFRRMLTDMVDEQGASHPGRSRRGVWLAVASAAAVIAVIGGIIAGASGYAPFGSANRNVAIPPQTGAPSPLLPSPSATPRPTSTSTPVPLDPAGTESPTPLLNGVAVPNSWVIDYGGMGPVRLGSDARSQLLAAGFAEEDDSGCVAFFNWKNYNRTDQKSEGWGISFGQVDGGPGVRWVLIQGFFNDHTHALPGSPVTAAGIGIASSVDDLTAAYPDLRKIVDSGYYSQYVTGPVDGGYLHFYTGDSDGLVWMIQVNDTPEPEQKVC